MKMLTVHNPSVVDVDVLRIGAPADGAFKVYTLDTSAKSWASAPSDLICYTELDSGASEGKTCELFIKVTLKGHGLVHLKVESVSPEEEGAAKVIPGTRDKSIANENIRIEYVQHIDGDGTLFTIVDKQTNQEFKVDFSMKYYKPQQYVNLWFRHDEKNSGAYVFLPAHDDNQKKPYSKFSDFQVYKSEQTGVQQMAVFYKKKTTSFSKSFDKISKFGAIYKPRFQRIEVITP